MKKITEPLFENKLSKKFFMGLPNSVYVVSNIGFSPTQRVFADNIKPESLRLEQWKKIVAAGADQRLCMVFKNKIEYDNWLVTFRQMIEKK